jgi:hypothetical protein
MGSGRDERGGAKVRPSVPGRLVRVATATALRAVRTAPVNKRVDAFLRAGVGRIPLGRRGWIAAGAAAVSVVVGGLVVVPAAMAAADPCVPLINPVACENSKAGSPASEWDIYEAGEESIQGFATDISVNLGGTIRFKIKTPATAYKIDIYRLGWYNGDGARKITSVTPSVSLPQTQPACLSDTATENFDCGNWAVSAQWTVPTTVVSGVFVAKLTRTDPSGNGDSSHITFVVRDDSSTSDLFFQTSDTTWHAYNMYGGSNFYHGGDNGRAFKISYNRPFGTRGNNPEDFLFSNEYPMLRFLERNGYDTSYTTGVDSDRRGNLIKNHQVFLSVGHDEYWSNQQRANVESARDAGVNLAFFSGNEVYWKTRYEASTDGSNTAYRTLVCYKETWANDKIDPTTEWTGTWRDPRFTPPSNGNRPENALTGTAYMSNNVDLAIQVPATQGKYRLWRNSTVASRAATNQATTLAPHTVGYESDEDLDNGFRPPGLIRLSTTTGETPEYLRDYGNTVTPGTTTHHLTLYRAASGALVFGAGTIQWAWGLDEYHDGTVEPVDPSMQQATLNLLGDMGAFPGTIMSGRTMPTASNDSTAPTTTITSPAVGASVVNGNQVTVTGTAADTGGQVAGVEVSYDGGEKWHPATGTTSWSYSFYTTGAGTQSILARAIDDTANIGQPASRTVNLTGPSTIFGARAPVTAAVSDTEAMELGVRFTPQTDGYITGIRFYKGTGNTGTHTGTLWSNGGSQLATATFSGETATGWQKVTFANSVLVHANTTYVASYYAPNGHYAGDQGVFTASNFVSYPLTALRSNSEYGNGVYKEGAGFPAGSYKDSNYFVDVMFTPSSSAAPTVLSALPLPDSTDMAVTTKPAAVFSKAINPSSLVFTVKNPSNASVAGSVAYDSTSKTATFTPAASLAPETMYTVSVQASDTSGNAMDSPRTWTFTTELDPTVSRLFATNASPVDPSVNDNNAVELGVKFTPQVNGTVVGVRFYKGAGNSGTHVGTLWSSGGTQMGRVTFTNEGGTGWQTARFATPVTVNAGTTYVASYHAPNGHYSATGNFFTSAYTFGQMSAPSGNNGVYNYSSTPAFPQEAYNSTNYWVEPMFIPGSGGGPSPTPTSSPTPSPTASPTPTTSPTPTPSPTETQWPTGTTIFTASDTPASTSWNDNGPIEVGAKFRSDVAGTVTAIRFYKGSGNTGTHTGTIWSTAGEALGTVTFTNESASGWQTATLTTPVTIAANTTYVVSYFAPAGHYAATVNGFGALGLDRPPLHVPGYGGVYRYGSGGVYPNNGAGHNYWVDVVFQAS